MSELAIAVHGLVKRFGDKRVVDGLSLEVRRGEIFGFLGPNGSGKTTSLRMLCGLLTPDGGSGTCLGFDVVRETQAIKREVGYMTQAFSLYGDLTIEENLDFVARMYGMRARRAAVARALESLGFSQRRRQLAGQLSGGWKQRLMLAACMLHEPRLLLLDEPTAGVDPRARRDFWEEIHALAARGITVLVSTHYMDEAERCHRVAYLSHGRVLVQGAPAEVVAASKLVTWRVEGVALQGLMQELRGLPGVELVVPFGTALHVSGTDAALLAASLAPYQDRPGLSWTPSQPNLEDVFVKLSAGREEPLT